MVLSPHSDPAFPIPGITDFAYGRLLNADDTTQSLAITADGHLMVRVNGEIMTRTDALLLCSENLATRPLNRRMQGRAVPQVFQRLVSLEGEGHMVLSREDQHFYALQLRRGPVLLRGGGAVGARGLADVGRGLAARLAHGPRDPAGAGCAGEGALAVRVPGELVAVKIAPERPYRVHIDGFVGWVGNVVPRMERGVPFLHCEGEGAVFVSLPRPDAPVPPDFGDVVR